MFRSRGLRTQTTQLDVTLINKSMLKNLPAQDFRLIFDIVHFIRTKEFQDRVVAEWGSLHDFFVELFEYILDAQQRFRNIDEMLKHATSAFWSKSNPREYQEFISGMEPSVRYKMILDDFTLLLFPDRKLRKDFPELFVKALRTFLSLHHCQIIAEYFPDAMKEMNITCSSTAYNMLFYSLLHYAQTSDDYHPPSGLLTLPAGIKIIRDYISAGFSFSSTNPGDSDLCYHLFFKLISSTIPFKPINGQDDIKPVISTCKLDLNRPIALNIARKGVWPAGLPADCSEGEKVMQPKWAIIYQKLLTSPYTQSHTLFGALLTIVKFSPKFFNDIVRFGMNQKEGELFDPVIAVNSQLTQEYLHPLLHSITSHKNYSHSEDAFIDLVREFVIIPGCSFPPNTREANAKIILTILQARLSPTQTQKTRSLTLDSLRKNPIYARKPIRTTQPVKQLPADLHTHSQAIGRSLMVEYYPVEYDIWMAIRRFDPFPEWKGDNTIVEEVRIKVFKLIDDFEEILKKFPTFDLRDVFSIPHLFSKDDFDCAYHSEYTKQFSKANLRSSSSDLEGDENNEDAQEEKEKMILERKEKIHQMVYFIISVFLFSPQEDKPQLASRFQPFLDSALRECGFSWMGEFFKMDKGMFGKDIETSSVIMMFFLKSLGNMGTCDPKVSSRQAAATFIIVYVIKHIVIQLKTLLHNNELEDGLYIIAFHKHLSLVLQTIPKHILNDIDLVVFRIFLEENESMVLEMVFDENNTEFIISLFKRTLCWVKSNLIIDVLTRDVEEWNDGGEEEDSDEQDSDEKGDKTGQNSPQLEKNEENFPQLEKNEENSPQLEKTDDTSSQLISTILTPEPEQSISSSTSVITTTTTTTTNSVPQQQPQQEHQQRQQPQQHGQQQQNQQQQPKARQLRQAPPPQRVISQSAQLYCVKPHSRGQTTQQQVVRAGMSPALAILLSRDGSHNNKESLRKGNK